MEDKLFGLISTYGICLAIAFLITMKYLPGELKRKGLDPKASDMIVMAAMIGGIVGAKIAYIIEFRAEIFKAGFWDNLIHFSGYSPEGYPYLFWKSLFSGGGLTFYGGFLLATALVLWVFKRKNIPLMRGTDIAVIFVAIGYGFGRLGCFVSGDGCYGNAVKGSTFLFPPFIWKYPTSAAFPSGGYVYNTPIFEAIVSWILAYFLYRWNKQSKPVGFLTSVFLIVHGLSRFIVEFFRHNTADIPIKPPPKLIGAELSGDPVKNWEILNTHYWYGFTQAQIISILLILAGIVIAIKYRIWQTPAEKKGD